MVVEDVSDSRGTLPLAPPDDDVAARLDVADGVRANPTGEAPDASLARGRSRLGDGLRAAARVLGREPGVIRLRTDGRDTEGDVVRAAREVVAQGHLLFVEGPSPWPADVALDSVRVVSVSGDPGAGEPRVEVAVSVAASVSGRVRVSLSRDGAERDARTTDVSPDATASIRLVDPAGPRSTDVYEVRLVALDGTPDDDRVNDRVRFERPSLAPRILIVGDGARAAVVDRGVRVTRVASIDDADLDATDLLVLSNQPWRALRGGAFVAIERFVAEGGVLATLGGEDAYGRGGVAGTPYELLLALRPRQDDADSIGCVVALDRSGSTGEATGGASAPIDDLRRAVRALARAMPPAATLTVLPFGDAPDAPLAIERAGGADDEAVSRVLAARLDGVVPAGGTDLPRAIEGAMRVASSMRDVRRRRVFLLTDGDPDHKLTAEGLAPLREALSGAGVEFAAVVRGDEAAAIALRTLAARAEDVVRIARSDEFPESLLRTFDRGASPGEFVVGPFATTAAAGSELSPAAAAVARLGPSRIHRLDPAPDAVVWARSSAPDGTSFVLAASRRHGAGAVLSLAAGPALESGAGRDRTEGDLTRVFDEVSRSVDRGAAAERDGDRLTVESTAGLGSLHVLVGEATDPVTLLEASSGLYEGTLPSGTPVDALLRIEAGGDGPRALRLPYRPPLEHRGAGADLATMRAIAQAGGGRLLGPSEPTPRRRTSSKVDLSPYGFVMAVILLVVDRLRARRDAHAPVAS